MINVAEVLAQRILDELPGNHHPKLAQLLAAGLSGGLAAIPDPTPGSRLVYLVLDSPLQACRPDEPDFLPVFLVGQLGRRQRQRLCRSGAVSWWFRKRARGGRRLKPPGPHGQKWVRASTESFAWIAADGHLPEATPTTPDPHGFGVYEWHPLKQVPAGTIIYRIDSAGILTLFQRLSNQHKLWGRISLPATADAVDVHRLVAELQAELGKPLTLLPTDLAIPPMTQIPQELSPLLQSSKKVRTWRRQQAAKATSTTAS